MKVDEKIQGKVEESKRLGRVIDKLQTEKAKLVEALMKYGEHSKECIAEKYPETWHCICGFTKAIKEVR